LKLHMNLLFNISTLHYNAKWTSVQKCNVITGWIFCWAYDQGTMASVRKSSVTNESIWIFRRKFYLWHPLCQPL